MIRPSCSASSPKRCWSVTRGSNLGPIRSSTSGLAGQVQRQDRIIVTLPASEITDDVAENLHLALRRYCEARLTLVQRETQVAWRQGLRSLGSGSILFLVGLLSPLGFWSRTFRSSGKICSATESSPSSAPVLLDCSAAQSNAALLDGESSSPTTISFLFLHLHGAVSASLYLRRWRERRTYVHNRPWSSPVRIFVPSALVPRFWNWTAPLLAAAAHRNGATTNDAVLVAVAAALHQILLSRREFVDPIVITVPVSGRRPGGGRGCNLVSPMLVNVPATGELGERLRRVEAAVHAHKATATGRPPIAVLGGLFRFLVRLGGYRFYMNHQHRFRTLVTHVRGPVEPVRLDGHEVSAQFRLPRAATTVYFEALSYASDHHGDRRC